MITFGESRPMEEILKYFPDLSDYQVQMFKNMEPLYQDWNAKINVISRKDIGELYIKHVLHSLAIAKVQPFRPGANILDVGTGGGFPGIPLAILFPQTHFHLVDVIQKKINVVDAITGSLNLKNVTTAKANAIDIKGSFDFIVSRAVTNMTEFVNWTEGKVKPQQQHGMKNGILYLKGGDLMEELKNFPEAVQYNISDFFANDFFETKKVVHLPIS